MMKKTTNRILAILLIAQLGLIVLAFWPREHKPAATALINDLGADAVREMILADDQGKSLTLKKDESGQWFADDGVSPALPADAKLLEKTLASLTGLQSQRLVTRTRASHVRLQVDDQAFARKVTLRGDSDTVRTLFLGTAPGQQNIHVRAEGSDDVYLARGISAWELTTERDSWLARDYLLVDRDKVQEVRLQNGHNDLTLKKTEKGWLLAAAETEVVPTSTEALDSLLQRATRLTLTTYLGTDKPEMALDAATLTLVTEKETVTVEIGAKNDKDPVHVVKSSASPYYVTVSDYQIAPLLDATVDSLKDPAQTAAEGNKDTAEDARTDAEEKTERP
ncbi:MAG: DUF4340 domain-containing protein [Thermodesulfobacteriota bacterium]